MTPPQIVSLVSIVLLTAITIIVGINLVLVLKELRYSLQKINQTLDLVSSTVDRISQPILGVLALIEGLKESSKIFDVFSKIFSKDKETQDSNYRSYENDTI